MTRARQRRLVRFLGPPAVAVLVGVLAAAGLHGGAFQGTRRRAADALFPVGVTDDRIVVVAIDERSLDETGVAWPWPRSMQAQLLDRLASAGADVVVDDVVLSPPAAGDDSLAAAMQAGPAVVVAAAARLRPDPDGVLLRTVARTDPAPTIAAVAATGIAAVTADPDDGVVRSLPLVVEDAKGHLTPSLALAALQAMRHDPSVVLRRGGVIAGGTSIPTDHRHGLTVSYPDGLVDGSRHVSAVDVLRGRISAPRLRHKIVFIGATDPTLGDLHLVPPQKRGGVAGVDIHAAALNTILTGAYVRADTSTRTVTWVALTALLAAALLLNLPLGVAFALVVAEVAGFVVLVLVRFQHGAVTDPVYPGLGIVAATVAALAARYVVEERQRRRVDTVFREYVPAPVARRLLDADVADMVAGARLDASVLFCDLRGFTAVAAALEPAAVRRLLDAYYEHVASLVLDHDGTVVQFVGDEVFAAFGAPLATTDHASVALAVALDVQRQRPALDAALAALDLPAVQMGVGVHTGPVVSAQVGSRQRRQYALVGDTVNVGSRLCATAGAGEVVASRALLDAVPAPPVGWVDLGTLELKGVPGPVAAVVFRSP